MRDGSKMIDNLGALGFNTRGVGLILTLVRREFVTSLGGTIWSWTRADDKVRRLCNRLLRDGRFDLWEIDQNETIE